MPRKEFRKHLEQASSGPLPEHVSQLEEGEDDGTFKFIFNHSKSASAVAIQAAISDVGDYPKSHNFFVFTVSDPVPEEISKAVEDLGGVESLTIETFLRFVSKRLNSISAPQTSDDEDHDMLEADDGASELQEPDEDDDYYDDTVEDYDEDLDAFLPATGGRPKVPSAAEKIQILESDMPSHEVEAFRNRISADSEEVRKAGFRVAHQGLLLQPGQSSYVMTSCRVWKLGIPEDAMKAWSLERNEYVMLLLHYPNGYKSLEEATRSWTGDPSAVNLHVAVTKHHKISLVEAIEAFTQIDSRKGDDVEDESKQSKESNASVRPLFMGAALNDLLNNRLSALISYRQGLNLGWTGAEAFYNDQQGNAAGPTSAVDSKYYDEHDSLPEQQFPALVTADHLAEKTLDRSFPLTAMQFTIRHIVHCTDFCLVCWCKTGDEFEALKPYVCSKPLCLFQYMTLGFGPSIEFEILAQPYVVDLLVSFCYVSTLTRHLRDFPIGLGIHVPHPQLLEPHKDALVHPSLDPFPRARIGMSTARVPEVPLAETKPPTPAINAIWDQSKDEFRMNSPEGRPFKAGTWVCFWGKTGLKRHCRITETWYPTLRHGPIIETKEEHEEQIPSTSPGPLGIPARPPRGESSRASTSEAEGIPVTIVAYDTHFDELSDSRKQSALVSLLSTLPSVTEMREYLQSKKKQGSLQAWTEKITPAALSVFRWVIASNRSCIVQPAHLDGKKDSSEEAVWGMPEHLQFRFASGAPDKESRFIQCVRDTTQRLGLKHPTLFAWHGSPLGNWHSIIRQGLNFDRVSHGRAFGDGVYHSLQSSVSLGYSGEYYASSRYWPSSMLQLGGALSLNEIVNAPREFTSSSPHLVVGNIDWIQTRYLFVRCKITPPQAAKPLRVLEQDPAMQPMGSTNRSLVMPLSAISKSRQPSTKSVKSGMDGQKRSRVSVEGSLDSSVVIDLESEASDEEDLRLFARAVQAREKAERVTKGLSSSIGRKPVPESKTPFRLGTLNYNTLPLLAAPSYATPQATRALQREIKTLLKTQSTSSPSELGWYLNPDQISNPYQLLFEMHSFPVALPLAQDMNSQKTTSIVLELRFGASFPFSPPFIRVIRPRFLPFLQGGGGHITAGGAVCMELLTNNGWNPSCGIEGVLLQVRMAMMSTDPKPARLESRNSQRGATEDYSVGEAIEAYKRACMTHGVSFFFLLPLPFSLFFFSLVNFPLFTFPFLLFSFSHFFSSYLSILFSLFFFLLVDTLLPSSVLTTPTVADTLRLPANVLHAVFQPGRLWFHIFFPGSEHITELPTYIACAPDFYSARLWLP